MSFLSTERIFAVFLGCVHPKFEIFVCSGGKNLATRRHHDPQSITNLRYLILHLRGYLFSRSWWNKGVVACESAIGSSGHTPGGGQYGGLFSQLCSRLHHRPIHSCGWRWIDDVISGKPSIWVNMFFIIDKYRYQWEKISGYLRSLINQLKIFRKKQIRFGSTSSCFFGVLVN